MKLVNKSVMLLILFLILVLSVGSVCANEDINVSDILFVLILNLFFLFIHCFFHGD